jgi:hypothetical protein
MTKLEELEAAKDSARAAFYAARAAFYAADAACEALDADYAAACDAYYDELKKKHKENSDD